MGGLQCIQCVLQHAHLINSSIVLQPVKKQKAPLTTPSHRPAMQGRYRAVQRPQWRAPRLVVDRAQAGARRTWRAARRNHHQPAAAQPGHMHAPAGAAASARGWIQLLVGLNEW